MTGYDWTVAHENFRRLHQQIWNLRHTDRRHDRRVYLYINELLSRHFPE